jgi:hypothetical protein
MEAGFPERPVIGLPLRLVYQHYAQSVDAALREAGFDNIRPGAANVFPFVPQEASRSRGSPSWPGSASSRWPKP